MESVELQEVRSLFEKFEHQTESGAKLSILREALSASHTFISGNAFSEEGLIAQNLHTSYLRNAVRQLISAQRISQSTQNGYVRLMVFGDSTTRSSVSNDPLMANLLDELSARYGGFFRP